MMLAAAAYAEPYSGGLLDQPAGLMKRMKIAKNIYNAFTGMHAAEDKAEWQEHNPGEWKLVQDIWNMKDEK
jgi:hypothetical protein